MLIFKTPKMNNIALSVILLLVVKIAFAAQQNIFSSRDIIGNITSFLPDNDDPLKLPLLNKEMYGIVPEDLLEACFDNKFDPIPEHFSPSKHDKIWFNKFTPEEVADEYFWATIIRACEAGVELKSCAGYVDHVFDLLLNYENQNETTKMKLLGNFDAFFKYLSESKDYEKISILLRLRLEDRISKRIGKIANDEYGDYSLLENVLLCVEDKDERVQLMKSFGINVHVVLFFMYHHPDSLVESSVYSAMNRLKTAPGISKLMLAYSHEMNHGLVANFKKSLVENFPYQERYYYSMVIEYLHDNKPIETCDIRPSKKCELAAIKGNWEDFKLLHANSNYKNGSSDENNLVLEAVFNNPEIIRTELMPSIDRNRSLYFKVMFSDKFISCNLKDPQTMTLLQIYFDHYSTNQPSVHEFILIYPGIKFDDYEMGILKYLRIKREFIENTDIIEKFDYNITTRAILCTILLTQRDPELLEKTLVGLIDEFGYLLKSANYFKQMIWEKSNFECFSKLLRNEKIRNFFKPSFFILNTKWEIKDYIKIFKSQEHFDLYQCGSNRYIFAKINPIQMIYHLNTLEETERFLEFIPQQAFAFKVEDYNDSFINPLIDFKLMLTVYSNDMENSLKRLNPYYIKPLLNSGKRNIIEIGKILEKWYLDPKHNRYFIKKTFEIIRTTNSHQITVNIKILKLDLLEFIYFAPDSINFVFDLDAILEEFEKLNSKELVRGIYDSLAANEAESTESLNKLKRLRESLKETEMDIQL